MSKCKKYYERMEQIMNDHVFIAKGDENMTLSNIKKKEKRTNVQEVRITKRNNKIK